MKPNFGGIFGGIIGAGAVIAILYILSLNGGMRPRGFRLIVLAAFGGAALGNWIWGLAQPQEPQDL